MSVQLLRNTRIFVSTVKSGFTTANTQEILVQDDISWGQDSNTTDITVNEAGPRPTRGSKRFNDSLNAADWSFSTYILPYLDSSGNLVKTPDFLLWNALSSGKPINLAGNTGAQANSTNFMVNFKDNAYHELMMLHIYILTDGAWSYIDSCQINQAEVSVDIEDIGRVTWSGNGNQLIPLDSAPFDPNTIGMSDALYLQLQSSYIKNKLTILKMMDLDSGKTYDIPITGGSFTINNNITYLTPNIMSRVNIPIGSFTGSFELTGSLTAYLNTKSLGSQELYKDLITQLKVINRFQIALVLGGEYDSERPAAVLVAKQATVGIPSIETDDVLGTTIEFKAIPTDMDTGDEGYLGFSSKYTKTSIANLIATGDGAKTTTAPTAPTLAVTAASKSVNYVITPPSNAATTGVVGYNITYTGPTSGTFNAGKALTGKISGLTSGSEYTFTVVAVAPGATSPASAAVKATPTA